MSKSCLKKIVGYLCLLLLMVSGQETSAQLNPPMGSSQWKYVTPFQYGFVVQDMSFVDNNNGLAVSNTGAIAKTTDAGYNWQYIFYKYVSATNQVTMASFNDVHFVTPSVAYAVALSGVMIKSTDGGINWTRIMTPLTPLNKNINALHFINKDTGYIAGPAINTTNTTNVNDAPKIYVTKDGGATWDSLITPFVRQETSPSLNWNNNKEVSRLYFVNDSVGYASGTAGLLWKIENNVITDYNLNRTKFGLITGTHTPSAQTYRGLIGVHDSLVLISSANNGIIVRVRTGKNDSTANANPAAYGPFVKGVYEIVAVSNTNPTIPANSPLVSTSMNHLRKTPDGKIAIANGQVVAFSSDNGSSWTASRPGVPHFWWSLTALDITPNGRIITGGSGGILYDSLSGASWRSQYKNYRPYTDVGTGSGKNALFDFTAMDFADCDNGVVVGAYGTFVKTSDGGETWVNNYNNQFEVGGMSIGNVSYPGPGNLFFTTSKEVWRSADQGTTNTNIFTEPNSSSNGFGINQFTMPSADRAFVAAFRGGSNVQRTVIFRTLNAGAASPVWDTVKTFPLGSTFAPQPRNIKFANIDTGYVSFNRGKVYRTVDGGDTWKDVSPDTTAAGNATANYAALSVVNGKTLYVGGSSRKLFRSTDAGDTWTDLTLQLTTPGTITANTTISNIIMNDAMSGYLVAGTYLLKTYDGWATWTYDLSPLAISNMQLYPKTGGPIDNKKLYLVMGPQQHSFANSQNTPTLIEYGNAAAYSMSAAETSTGASCTNPTAGSITVTATGGITPYQYSIDGGAFQSSNVFTGLTQGAKTITIKDAGCAVITETVTVPLIDNLTLTTNNDTTVCASAPVQMMATSQATTYSWAPAAGLSNAAISNPIATVSANTAYTVTATLNGCVKTKTVNIAIKPNPVVSAGPDKTIVEGDETQLQGSATNPVSVAWTPSNTLRDANTFTPMARPPATTTYTMTVKNTDNCTSTDNVIVTVMPYCVKVMDAFSPNGDGANDRWIVTNGTGCTSRVKVAVFNRYGQQVYINENYQNNWDGTFNGKPVPDGTYYYAVTYSLINGKTVIVKGDVTILR